MNIKKDNGEEFCVHCGSNVTSDGICANPACVAKTIAASRDSIQRVHICPGNEKDMQILQSIIDSNPLGFWVETKKVPKIKEAVKMITGKEELSLEEIMMPSATLISEMQLKRAKGNVELIVTDEAKSVLGKLQNAINDHKQKSLLPVDEMHTAASELTEKQNRRIQGNAKIQPQE